MVPPAAFDLLQPYAFFGLICWWLQADGARRGLRWQLDAGIFLYVAGFLLLPFYLIKTRGLRGLAGLLLFVGTVITAWVLASLVYLGLSGASEY